MTSKSKFATKSTIRWGIIGCGQVTEIKSGPAYQLTEQFELTAVMRRDYKKAMDYAQRHNIEKVFKDADSLINSDEVDAIYIATPPDTHKLFALKVCAAGKICCIEKPMSSCYQDSLAIYLAFQSKKLPLFVAYYRRSLPRFKKIKSMLTENVIGNVRHVTWNYLRPPSEIDLTQQSNWRTDKNVARGGYFDDLASHGLNLFDYLFGRFEQVSGVASNQQRLYSAYDSVAASWRHQNLITGSGSWNFASSRRLDQVMIYGDKGEIEFSMFADNPITISVNDISQSYKIKNPNNIQINHVEAMRDNLIYGIEPPSMGDSGLHTCWVMEKILNQ